MSSLFRLDALPDFAPLREAFRTAGFNAPALSATVIVHNPTDGTDIPLVLLRTEEPTPYNTLTRLLVLGQTVPESLARQALCPMPLEPLLDCNLLWRSADGIRAFVKLVPYEQYFFVSDFSHKDKTEAYPADFVLGVGPASVSLLNLVVRKPVATALDLGAGAGVQSIVAAGHVKKIIATDISSRALNFGAFNARLNGIDHIEWRAGSFFEPVESEQFDLVMANPPFVISPESSLLYRDGGGQGDAVSEHVVRGSARRLNEGGFASALINWHHKGEADWSERPLQWLTDNGCDSWLIRFSEADPALYASNWLRQTARQDSEAYPALLHKWIGYYKQAGIGRISSGAVILRKRTGGRNWTRHDCMLGVQAGGACGDHIQRIFAAEDFLQGLASDEQLLALRLQPHPDLAIDQRLVLHEGAWTINGLTMNLTRGLPFPGHADVHVLKLVAHCNGSRTVRESIELLAQQTNTPSETLTPTCLAVIKKMIQGGMLHQIV